jgi:hypothetical protein
LYQTNGRAIVHFPVQRTIIASDLPSRHFEPRIYGVGAWTDHLYFAYDLVAYERPGLAVELGTDQGESYFAFCQSVVENQSATRCFAVDTWKGDAQSGFYDETTFQRVAAHNRSYYESFSTLLRCSFDEALQKFADSKIDILHLDGLHTESAVRHDLKHWLPKLQPGGILLMHDVRVRSRDFAVWKIWDELRHEGRAFVFEDGPGLGLWEKPPPRASTLRDSFLDPTQNPADLLRYYRERTRLLREKISEEWRTGKIRETAFAQETIIQVFYSSDGTHCETDSVNARLEHNAWKDISIALPPGAGAAPLRIDFVSALNIIDIAALRVLQSSKILFQATTAPDFDKIDIRGDAERLPDPKSLRLKITGIDPQLYLPPLSIIAGDAPGTVEMRLQVAADAIPTD